MYYNTLRNNLIDNERRICKVFYGKVWKPAICTIYAVFACASRIINDNFDWMPSGITLHGFSFVPVRMCYTSSGFFIKTFEAHG